MKSIILISIITLSLSCFSQNISTKEDREALFNYIIEKTKDREAFSSPKEENLGFDPISEMLKLKEEVINASNDTELYYALQKLSCARRDKHLKIRSVENGINKPNVPKQYAPISFHPDYSDKNNCFLFVSDLGKSIDRAVEANRVPKIGDKLIKINGEDVNDYFEKARKYQPYSTIENLWRRFSYDIGIKSTKLPDHFYKDKLSLTLENEKGKIYDIELPYMDQVSWMYGRIHRNYPGYKEVESFEFDSFKLYTPTKSNNKTLLIWWYGFRADLPQAIDSLVQWADKNKKLHYDIIIDAIDSRGGSQGAYALSRLSPKSFKTTGGNIKNSDITYEFISGYTRHYLSSKQMLDGEGRETEDDGTWVIDWLNGPVLDGLKAGQKYSNNTPFKCAHLPHYSDWIMNPAQKHFTGNMVVFFGPWGGSHLSQFSAMINDNDLAFTLGMPDGGYSNTWEWSEVLYFPKSKKPVVEFMWSIGHTIRPNGEVLEGNPAQVDEYIPVTRSNFLEYKLLLLKKAETWLKSKK